MPCKKEEKEKGENKIKRRVRNLLAESLEHCNPVRNQQSNVITRAVTTL